MKLYGSLSFAMCLWLLSSRDAAAQVVQLPTTHNFGMSGSVWVPDQGGAFLGGVRRNATSQVRRGLPGFGAAPSGIGQQASHVGASVHVTIIDQQEMDRQILNQAPRSASPSINGAGMTGSTFGRGATRYRSSSSLNSLMDQHARRSR